MEALGGEGQVHMLRKDQVVWGGGGILSEATGGIECLQGGYKELYVFIEGGTLMFCRNQRIICGCWF